MTPDIEALCARLHMDHVLDPASTAVRHAAAAALRSQAGEIERQKDQAALMELDWRRTQCERTALQARVRELQDADHNGDLWCEEAAKLRAENERLRKDAERYRWLKEDCAFADLASMFDRNNDDIDPYIDAAMAAGEKP